VLGDRAGGAVKFMNDAEVDEHVRRFSSHPVLGPAARTLSNLRNWADRNSDGWAYWPKPARSAAKLMELIDRESEHYWRGNAVNATPAEYRRALAPIKAFRTRQGADFLIEEAL